MVLISSSLLPGVRIRLVIPSDLRMRRHRDTARLLRLAWTSMHVECTRQIGMKSCMSAQRERFSRGAWPPAHTAGPWPTYTPGNGFSTSREHSPHLRSVPGASSPLGLGRKWSGFVSWLPGFSEGRSPQPTSAPLESRCPQAWC